MSVIELASRLDELAAAGAIFVTETARTIVLAEVSAEPAAAILASVRSLGWHVTVVNSAAEDVDGALDPVFAPFRLTFQKPTLEGATRYLTLTGFNAWLADPAPGIVQVATASCAFETGANRISDWEDNTHFDVSPATKSPRALVRELNQNRVVPDDIRPWILRSSGTQGLDDPVFSSWRLRATQNGLRSLATEVSAGREICFSGSAQFWVTEGELSAYDMDSRRFSNIQKLVAWVYENSSDAETRFRLVNNEFGRFGRSGRGSVLDVADYAPISYESARLAFQYLLAKVSSDSAKALSDLRKSLSEETSRLAEMVRQIVTAVSGAVFVGIGLIAARFSSETPKLALLIMGVVVTGYVILIVISGRKQITLQREMRLVWRDRLYGYISNDDYKKMILDVAVKAEGQFDTAVNIGSFITFLIMLALAVALLS